MLNADLGVGCNSNSNGGCANQNGCPRVPDFCIKRNDTKPSLRISVSDCDGASDLTGEGLVLEASMWFEAKLKRAITNSETIISFADNMGFDQISIDDIIIVNKPRSPEQMVVIDINESDKTISVRRSHASTSASSLAKGTALRIFKFIDEPAEIESVFEDIIQTDGGSQNELVETFMVFNWKDGHTNLAGCYWLEFKLIMLSDSNDILWTKRTPLSDYGFLISVIDSSTPNT
jgi:hypothetical protein